MLSVTFACDFQFIVGLCSLCLSLLSANFTHQGQSNILT